MTIADLHFKKMAQHGTGGQNVGPDVGPLAQCMAWRAIPRPLYKRKRRLDSLEAAQVKGGCLLSAVEARGYGGASEGLLLPLATRMET